MIPDRKWKTLGYLFIFQFQSRKMNKARARVYSSRIQFTRTEWNSRHHFPVISQLLLRHSRRNTHENVAKATGKGFAIRLIDESHFGQTLVKIKH